MTQNLLVYDVLHDVINTLFYDYLRYVTIRSCKSVYYKHMYVWYSLYSYLNEILVYIIAAVVAECRYTYIRMILTKKMLKYVRWTE